ncbi:hypothetical protein N7495_006716 [Penicillium taxi]|uniref:uncharacterized protein n=1 Tax=Penicillium taxi TaxID=168475 RepID=UPI0025452553|nr:uncharacterized protein N7495_006716 [Penicillium taxi]KAJ5895025.1 hypothetical protein N7495_006716 [Penicillium taxi]
MPATVKFIFGGGLIESEALFPSLDYINEVLNLAASRGIKTIDTATIYGKSEELLGNVDAKSRFAIDTKYPGGFSPVPSTKESVLATVDQSLKQLKTDQIDVYYIHGPDRRISLETLLEAVNSAYQDGKFKRFGLSNYLAEEVEEVVRICREKGYVLPSIYQGNYSAVARRAEKEILPTLRKHKIAFYAYSPIAGGFLTKDVENFEVVGGRWEKTSKIGGVYHRLYNKPALLEGLKLWEKISKESGIPKAELAYRWVAHNSALSGELGDGVVVGSRTIEQLNQTFDGLDKGPLDVKLAEQVAEVWKTVENESPLDNLNA